MHVRFFAVLALVSLVCGCPEDGVDPGDDDSSATDDDSAAADDDTTEADDDDTGVTDCLYYLDSDADGYGDPDEEILESCDGPPEGYVADADDCDDTNAEVHPGADELCDGLDNDCDGLEDEDLGLLECHTDADGDGFGDAAGPVSMQCECGPGSVADGSDCDDADPDIHPDAEEVCDGIDNNCNNGMPPEEVADDGDGWMLWDGDCDDTDPDTHPDAEELCDGIDNNCNNGMPPGENDGDGDGWKVCDGDCDDTDPPAHPAAPELCDGIDNNCNNVMPPDEVDDDGDGWMVCDGDCDDTNASVWPGAVEQCDRADNDCDGSIPADEADDDGDLWSVCAGDCDDQDATIHPNAAEQCDGVDADCDGDLSEGCGVDVDADGWTVDQGDCDDGDGAVNPGQPEICGDGIDNDCDGMDDACGPAGVVDLSVADAILIGEEAGDNASYARSLAFAGDVDGDGFDDVLVGARSNDSGGADAGTAYLFYGPVYGTNDLSAADARLIGENPGDTAAWSVAPMPDANGDAYGDLLIGAAQEDTGGTDAGAVYVVHGPLYGDLDLGTAQVKLTGESGGDLAGACAVTGDVDGDGYDDVVVGARHHDAGGSDSGAAYVVYGPLVGNSSLASADAKLVGEASGDYAGWFVAAGGDVDGDAVEDVLVSALYQDAGGSSSGATYLLYGPVYGMMDLSTADAKLIGEEPGDQAGWQISFAGDVDGDGLEDVIVGAGGNDATGSGAGAAYLLLGPLFGDVDLSNSTAIFHGEAAGDWAGTRVSDAGDVNDDGYDDFLIGAYQEDTGGTDAGAIYLVYGPRVGIWSLGDADIKFIGETAEDRSSETAFWRGDVDGDGFTDLLLGGRGNDVGGNEAGIAYIFYGGGL